MVDIIADLHLHSHYSRAVSPQMVMPVMAETAKQKGIGLLATGDWTHPLWFGELRSRLEESEEGLYRIRDKKETGSSNQSREVRFLLSVEIATIFSQGGKGRRIHQLVFVPSFETAEKVNRALAKRGYNLASDGRPIIGLSSKNLLTLLLEIDERCLLIPAHVWTPWFGIYGQMSGFYSLDEAFEDMAPYVYGIETGLSSDPGMNWQIQELKTRSILSFSDAHSPAKMGREATVFELEEVTYENIRKAIMAPSKRKSSVFTREEILTPAFSQEEVTDKNVDKVLYTVEFYPEEGKYHYSGHRRCSVVFTPEEQQAAKSVCPVCKRKVTDGVMRRVGELSDQVVSPMKKINGNHVVWIADPTGVHPRFAKIVPLNEIISEAVGNSVGSQKVKNIYNNLCRNGMSEFEILLTAPIQTIEIYACSATTSVFAKRIAEGIERVRRESIVIKPGYDGVYGEVKIWQDEENQPNQTESKQEVTQSTLDI